MHILGLKGMTAADLYLPGGNGLGAGQSAGDHGRVHHRDRRRAVYRERTRESAKPVAVAGNDPWEAGTLEWAAASPPAHYNFAHLPVVTSRYPLWAAAGRADRCHRTCGRPARGSGHQLMDAEPQHRYVLPGSSIWPFLTALGASDWAGGIGVSILVVLRRAGAGRRSALIGWFWPRKPLELEP